MGARACNFLLQAPYEREARINNPILQKYSAEMINIPDASFLDQLLRQLYRRREAIAEANHMLNAGFLGRFKHLARIG
ncbi:hypothetical protein D3C80_2073650 [compost metagenome]